LPRTTRSHPFGEILCCPTLAPRPAVCEFPSFSPAVAFSIHCAPGNAGCDPLTPYFGHIHTSSFIVFRELFARCFLRVPWILLSIDVRPPLLPAYSYKTACRFDVISAVPSAVAPSFFSADPAPTRVDWSRRPLMAMASTCAGLSYNYDPRWPEGRHAPPTYCPQSSPPSGAHSH